MGEVVQRSGAVSFCAIRFRGPWEREPAVPGGRSQEDRGQRTEVSNDFFLSSVLCPLSSVLCPLSSVFCPLSDHPAFSFPHSTRATQRFPPDSLASPSAAAAISFNYS